MMVVAKVLELVDAGDKEGWAAHFTDDCEFVMPGATLTGPDAAWDWIEVFIKAFPDIKHRVITSFESGLKEAAEIVVTGTHTAPLVSPDGEIPATGRAIVLPACDIVTRGENGLVRAYHVYFDQSAFVAQLGIGG